MSISNMLGFGQSSINEGFDFENSSIDPEINAITLESVEAFTGDPFEYMVAAVYENELNFERIDRCMILNEYSYLLENGQEMVFEAGKLKGFFETAKNAIVSLFKKIVQFFKVVGSKIADLFKSSEAFADKYEPIFKNKGLYGKAVPLTKEVKVVDTVDTINTTAKTLLDAAAKEVGSLNITTSEVKDRNPVKVITAKEYDSIEKYMEDELDKKTRSVAVAATFFTELRGAVKTKKALKELLDKNKKAVNEAIKSLKKAENDLNKKDDGEDAVKKAHEVVSYAKKVSSVLPAINSSAVKRINARVKYIKTAVRLVVKYHGDAEARAGKAGAAPKASTEPAAAANESALFDLLDIL